MKLHFIKSPLALSLVLSIMATGCLKDKAFDNGEIQSVHSNGGDPKIVEIALTATNSTNFLAAAFENSSNDTVVDLVPVTLATPDVAAEDVHVTLVPNNQLVTDYNFDNTDTTVTPSNPNPTGVVTHLLIPTSVMYTVVNPGGEVIIPKGSHTGYLQIKFKPSDFLGAGYAVGFSIGKVAESGYTISGNNQNGIVGINIKNEWDGDYKVTGWFFHPSAGRAINTAKHLSTISSTGVETAIGDLGLGSPFSFNVINDQTTIISGAFLSTDFMTLDNPGGTDYSSNDGHLPGDADFNSTIYNNTYDPATKTFYLHYGYNAGVVGGQSVFTRQIYEKWVKQ
jgi:hypothetical protein